MKNETLKVGSIVKMSYCTYASNENSNWEIIRRYYLDDTEMIEYRADCLVCNVTNNFFQVIIPHSNSRSVRYSKKCFTETKHSYANAYENRPEIVTY